MKQEIKFIWHFEIPDAIRRAREWARHKVVKAMPNSLKAQAFVQVFAHSTTGKYGETLCDTVPATEVYRRFYKDKVQR